MKSREKISLVFCLLAFILLANNNLYGQWRALKKGFQEEVKVAVESDTMLVAHINSINFSFIATLSITSSTDIYRDATTDAKELWVTTDRFWNRFLKTKKRLKVVFKETFFANLRHPQAFADRTSSSQHHRAGTVDTAKIARLSPKQSVMHAPLNQQSGNPWRAPALV